MNSRFLGFGHVGVSTHDMGETIDFYARVLECPVIADERIEINDGGEVRQVSIAVGPGQYIVFMQATGVDGISEDYDTSINAALQVPAGMYHYAFRVASLDDLQSEADRIAALGIEVSELTDLGVAKSVFLQDPNGLQLELTAKVRDFDESDIGRVTRANVAPNADVTDGE